MEKSMEKVVDKLGAVDHAVQLLQYLLENRPDEEHGLSEDLATFILESGGHNAY